MQSVLKYNYLQHWSLREDDVRSGTPVTQGGILEWISKHHGIHDRDGLLPVSIVLDRDGSRSKHEVLRVV